jgi:hypothetical protein
MLVVFIVIGVYYCVILAIIKLRNLLFSRMLFLNARIIIRKTILILVENSTRSIIVSYKPLY